MKIYFSEIVFSKSKQLFEVQSFKKMDQQSHATTTATALVCLSKTETGIPNCFRITTQKDSSCFVTKVVADEKSTLELEPMQYKIVGEDNALRKRLVSHLVDNYAISGPDNIWEVIDLDE